MIRLFLLLLFIAPVSINYGMDSFLRLFSSQTLSDKDVQHIRLFKRLVQGGSIYEYRRFAHYAAQNRHILEQQEVANQIHKLMARIHHNRQLFQSLTTHEYTVLNDSFTNRINNISAKEFRELCNESPEVRRLRPVAQRAAQLDQPILVTEAARQVAKQNFHTFAQSPSNDLLTFSVSSIPQQNQPRHIDRFGSPNDRSKEYNFKRQLQQQQALVKLSSTIGEYSPPDSPERNSIGRDRPTVELLAEAGRNKYYAQDFHVQRLILGLSEEQHKAYCRPLPGENERPYLYANRALDAIVDNISNEALEKIVMQRRMSIYMCTDKAVHRRCLGKKSNSNIRKKFIELLDDATFERIIKDHVWYFSLPEVSSRAVHILDRDYVIPKVLYYASPETISNIIDTSADFLHETEVLKKCLSTPDLFIKYKDAFKINRIIPIINTNPHFRKDLCDKEFLEFIRDKDCQTNSLTQSNRFLLRKMLDDQYDKNPQYRTFLSSEARAYLGKNNITIHDDPKHLIVTTRRDYSLRNNIIARYNQLGELDTLKHKSPEYEKPQVDALISNTGVLNTMAYETLEQNKYEKAHLLSTLAGHALTIVKNLAIGSMVQLKDFGQLGINFVRHPIVTSLAIGKELKEMGYDFGRLAWVAFKEGSIAKEYDTYDLKLYNELTEELEKDPYHIAQTLMPKIKSLTKLSLAEASQITGSFITDCLVAKGLSKTARVFKKAIRGPLQKIQTNILNSSINLINKFDRFQLLKKSYLNYMLYYATQSFEQEAKLHYIEKKLDFIKQLAANKTRNISTICPDHRKLVDLKQTRKGKHPYKTPDLDKHYITPNKESLVESFNIKLTDGVKNVSPIYQLEEIDHLFKLQVKCYKGKKLELSGFHHDYQGLIKKSGILMYENIEHGPLGTWKADVVYKGFRKKCSFFPDHWTHEEVIDAIAESLKNVEMHGSTNFRKIDLEGKIIKNDQQLKIRIITNKFGDIITVYPDIGL